MRIVIKFRGFLDLLVLDNSASGWSQQASLIDLTATPSLSNVQLWANYAIVSNAERVKMGAAPRDIAIEQVQSVPAQNVTVVASPSSVSRDLRLSHAVKVIFFAMRNTTVNSNRSNYTCASAVRTGTTVNFAPTLASDPISTTSLLYENTTRLNAMGSDYFSLVQPYYQCRTFFIPTVTGYHMYSYSLDLISLDPMGSTNYGKLTNISMSHTFSPDAVTVTSQVGVFTFSAPAPLATSGAPQNQTFQTLYTVVNNNVVRISGGALGFPVL
jgi:hypothetical protein